MFNDIIKVYICMHLYEIECILQARLSVLLVLLVSSYIAWLNAAIYLRYDHLTSAWLHQGYQ